MRQFPSEHKLRLKRLPCIPWQDNARHALPCIFWEVCHVRHKLCCIMGDCCFSEHAQQVTIYFLIVPAAPGHVSQS